MDERVKDALRRRALGFEADEVVEEYAVGEDGAQQLKRKVTKKTVPPDVAAAKMLSEEDRPLAALSPEELRAEKERLLGLLREGEEK